MKIEIKQYVPRERRRFINMMEDFQDYLVNIDYMKRTRRMPGYGLSYVRRLLRRIKNNDGVIYLAKHEGQTIGLIAAVIEQQSEEDLLEYLPSKSGRILELYVESQYRRLRVGKVLMERAEEYLRQKQCDVLRIEVFEPNTNAHGFYNKLGYHDRVIDMIKML
jgi:ribosomal protein S18 acetylase RimI-like enzyme